MSQGPANLVPHRFRLAAVTMLGAATMIAATTSSVPPRPRTATPKATSPRPRQAAPPPVTPLDVHPAQFRAAGTELPSWVVQLELDPRPTAAAAASSRAAVDAVVRDTIGSGRVTQRYEHAVVGFAAFGATLADVIKVRIYTTDITLWKEIAAVMGPTFGETRPANLLVEVSGLVDGALVEIEADAWTG